MKMLVILVIVYDIYHNMNYGKYFFANTISGWTSTDGVEAAYGSSKSFLEPLRTLWQGAEGIIWLAVADSQKIQSGGK